MRRDGTDGQRDVERGSRRAGITKIRTNMTVVALAAMLTAAGASGQDQSPVMPKHGFVPKAETAVRIAEASLVPIYGEDVIAGEQPLVASLRDGVWYVVGTLPERTLGGVAETRIQKRDARILCLTHAK